MNGLWKFNNRLYSIKLIVVGSFKACGRLALEREVSALIDAGAFSQRLKYRAKGN
ncbi:MAG: hypothetical protein MJK04_35275 [Psychrosphaera sp.]|nr:hypothetical protein [Psychrosphaera sp.]